MTSTNNKAANTGRTNLNTLGLLAGATLLYAVAQEHCTERGFSFSRDFNLDVPGLNVRQNTAYPLSQFLTKCLLLSHPFKFITH